jgi:hypothetical protein
MVIHGIPNSGISTGISHGLHLNAELSPYITQAVLPKAKDG